MNFSLETNGKLMALGVPILKHFRVMSRKLLRNCSKRDHTDMEIFLSFLVGLYLKELHGP